MTTQDFAESVGASLMATPTALHIVGVFLAGAWRWVALHFLAALLLYLRSR